MLNGNCVKDASLKIKLFFKFCPTVKNSFPAPSAFTTIIDSHIFPTPPYSWKTGQIFHVLSPAFGNAQKTIFEQPIAGVACGVRMEY